MDGPLEQRLEALEAADEIRRLKALYCRLADRGYDTAGDDPDAFAALFTEDGVWETSSRRAVGRPAIAEHLRTFRGLALHLAVNDEIRVEGDRATGRWSLLCPGNSNDGRALWTAGTYDDEFVRTPDGWRFSRVRFVAAFRTPYEEGWARTRFA